MTEDLVGSLGPGEGMATVVPAVDEEADGVHQLLDTDEGTAADGLPRDDAEEDLDEVQPGARGRCEVQRDAAMAGQPGLDVGVLMGCVVVDHHVQLLARVSAGHLLQEGEELLVAVKLIAGLGHVSGGHLQGGEQGGGAVTHVVVRGSLGQAGTQGQDRRGAIEGLDLALLIDAEHDRLLRRVEVETDDVAHLGLKGGVGGELELLSPPGLQPVAPPTAGHGGIADPKPAASRRLDQWVTPRPAGGGSRVRARISASSTVRGRPERGASAKATRPPAR